jgi:putative component of membrane protein insertase Oxa1/YidC/SpoIIIJ protein YidD
MTGLVRLALRGYKVLVSPLLGPSSRFNTSC